MSNAAARFQALSKIADARPPAAPEAKSEFAENVFDDRVMRQRLPKSVYLRFRETIRGGNPLDPQIADVIANAMKDWAGEHGATHYSHWFQPLSSLTAGKHDAFLEPAADGRMLSAFSGKLLVRGEPDASSFPSGGIRSTFEARGYTAWDPTSPAFLDDGPGGKTLRIPTAFCSYTGEALDWKTPLLRANEALSKQAMRVLRLFGGASTRVDVTVGAEQEYFLVDRRLFMLRPDLANAGRTLYGAKPAKGQELDDHYFGSIHPRVLAFMHEAERRLFRLGVPVKTRHNEAAPAQFEVALVFEELNLAVDHNMLTIEVLRQVAERHNFVCLLHEKPFAGINGSGKHNNWSFSIGGTNLLNPGRDPFHNTLFLTALCAVIQAVDRHGDLLRASVAGLGNDHRLGGNEAPPSIISIYLGDELTRVIEALEKGDTSACSERTCLAIGPDVLPTLSRDTTDRNRTSPFAYTGNKFEFRAPGASQSCADPNIVLNTIVAEAIDEIATRLEAVAPDQFNETLQSLLRAIVVKHKRIIFNGDNYSEEWVREAESRGLPNVRNTPESLRALIQPENIALFDKYGVFSPVESYSRFEVFMAEYKLRLTIEGELSVGLAKTVYFPVLHEQLTRLGREIETLEKIGAGGDCTAEARRSLEQIGRLFCEAGQLCRELEKSVADRACDDVVAKMAELRRRIDALEKMAADDLWPMPKYREMLFIY